MRIPRGVIAQKEWWPSDGGVQGKRTHCHALFCETAFLMGVSDAPCALEGLL